MKKYSVVVPVYNASGTIIRCVRSILDNSFKDIEIVLVDDCSTDGSYDLCKNLENENKVVRLVHNEKNRGVSFTRNAGVAAAEGKYIMFVDSDDWVDSDYISVLDKAVETYPQSIPVCGYVNHDDVNGLGVDDIIWKEKDNIDICKVKTDIKSIYDKLLLQQLWNKVFVNEIVKNNNIKFDESISIGEDLRFILAYIKCSKLESFVMISKPLYHYMRDQANSLMYKVGYESVDEPLKNLRSLYEVMGMSTEEIKKTLAEDRKRQMQLYAYLIFHNAGMKKSEKKRLILALDDKEGKSLYKRNHTIYLKEKVLKLIKK